jgi:hypothetical protein
MLDREANIFLVVAIRRPFNAKPIDPVILEHVDVYLRQSLA